MQGRAQTTDKHEHRHKQRLLSGATTKVWCGRRDEARRLAKLKGDGAEAGRLLSGLWAKRYGARKEDAESKVKVKVKVSEGVAI